MSESLEKLFYAGEFKQITQKYEDGLVKSSSSAVLIVGSYAFLGDLQKAQLALKQLRLEKSAQALFFMSVMYTRSSNYDKAKKLLVQMLIQHLKNKKARPEDTFYIYQGLGFYRYFCGRYSKALIWAQKAQPQKKSKDYAYQQLINSDLLSHILIRMGQIHHGLKLSETALTTAKALKNNSAIDAIEVGRSIYQSQYNIKTEQTLLQILRLKEKFQAKNSYYYFNLTFEYVRRLNLQGDLRTAEQELESIKKELFESSLDRQKAVWCFRWAHILFLSRKSELALDMIESALDYLDQNIDLYLSLQILGLRFKILKLQEASDLELHDLEQTIRTMTFLSQDATALSYAYRYGWVKKPITEDPFSSFFHQWIREGYKNYALIKQVLQKKWFALFVDLIPRSSKNFIYLDILPKQMLLLGTDHIFLKDGLTPLIRQALLLLSRTDYTKKEFVEVLWGYQYDAFRHDPLIYTLLGRIRELLGSLAPLLGLLKDQIELRQTEVRVYEHLQIPRSAAKLIYQPDSSEQDTNGLNRRQLEILEQLTLKTYLSVSETSKILHVSKITACRDLTELVLQKKIRRIGRGRATSYALTQIG